MDYKEDFLHLLGRRIGELRQERQLTIETLASAAGLDPGELAEIEAGKIDIPITMILHLAEAVDLPPDQFLNFLP